MYIHIVEGGPLRLDDVKCRFSYDCDKSAGLPLSVNVFTSVSPLPFIGEECCIMDQNECRGGIEGARVKAHDSDAIEPSRGQESI